MIFALVICSNEANAKEIYCEKVENYEWFYSLREQKTCFMNEVTKIDSQDFLIIVSRGDETVKGLRFAENKNISYLPVDIYKSFPGLLGIDATSSSVKSIKKENFHFLYNLTLLWLRGNQIEKIFGDTFETLRSLQGIDLRKKIQFPENIFC